MWEGAIAIASVAVMGPVSAAVGAVLIEWAHKFLAFRRLAKEPLVFVGARIKELRQRQHVIFGPCVITGLRVGRIELTGEDGTRITFTGREFESLDPIMESGERL